MSKNPDHYALVVGIDDYPQFKSLQGAKNDATAFSGWLMDQNHGGGLPPQNVKTVLSKPNPARPLHEDIDNALGKIFAAVKNSGAQRMYIYFSGHGLSRTSMANDLCLAAWSKQYRGRALDSHDYLTMIKDSGHFREIVMFLDCCRIRMVRKRALPPTIDPPKPGEGAGAARTFVAHATEFLSAAYEASLQNGEDPAPEGDETSSIRGHFTRALMKALSGEAAGPQGGVSASHLKQYLEIKTPEIARSAGHTQHIEINNGFNAIGEPTFGSATPLAAAQLTLVRISFSEGRAGTVILEDGNLDVLKQAPVDDGPWEFRLERGKYTLLSDMKEDSLHIRVTGEEEETKHVEF